MSFKYALGGKLFRGQVKFENASRVVADISGSGVGGGLAPSDYSVIGLPLVRGVDTVLIAGATDNENYTIFIRGRPFTVDSGVAATVTTIRDALLALIQAAEAATPALTTTSVASGADSIDITADVPGEALDTAVDADTPANISISGQSLDTAVGNVGIAGKKSGQMELRANAAVTATYELAIVG